MSTLDRNEYGQEWAHYEFRAIHGVDAEDAASPLQFRLEHLGAKDAQAVSCNTCGILLVPRVSRMRKHREQCGWEPRWP